MGTAMLASGTTASTMTITNGCSTAIELYTRLASIYTDKNETIAPGASIVKPIEKDYEGHFRNGQDDSATLIEVATKGEFDIIWYDLTIIPTRLKPGFEFCSSLEECKQHSETGIGFNTPIQITPTSNTNGANCREITCLADGCKDAYNYPKDDTKTHSCPFGTNFIVTFCPSGDSTPQQQEPTTRAGEDAPYSADTSAPDPADVYGGLAEDVAADAESTVPVTTLPDGEKAPEPSAQEPPAQDPADVYGGLAEDVDADAESTVPVTTLPDGEKAPEPSAQEPSTEAPSTEAPSTEVP